MHHRALFESSPNAYMVLDRELRYVGANEAYLRLTASRLDELVGRTLFEVFPNDPDDPNDESRRLLRESIERALRTGVRDHLALLRYRVPLETEEGVVVTERFWSATHTPIRDEHGEVAFVLQHTTDVTELESIRADAALGRRTTRDQLEAGVLERARDLQSVNATLDEELRHVRRLFDQAPGFMCVIRGPSYVFELANQAYLQLVGQRDIVGKPLAEALPELMGQGYLELLDRVRTTREPFVGRSASVTLERTPGAREERFVDFLFQPVIDPDGTVASIFVQGHDVTEQRRARDEVARYRDNLEEIVAERTRALEQSEGERRQAEDALRHSQKMEAVGSLTGGIAHDFNNILQVIGGNLALLTGDVASDERASRRLRDAALAVERGARLASQLLSFARKQALEPEVVDLGRLVQELSSLVRRATGEGVRIETRVPSDLWRTHVDRNQLENVILNLAINARDAMEGTGTLTIEARNESLDAREAARRSEASPGEYVVLSVLDTGCGMSREVLERAFEPFFTTKGEGRGTGLGLSMVYGFVRQTGGHVSIESEPGRGTRVRIHLPRTHRTDAPRSADRLPRSALEGGSETVLVVEDDPAVRGTVVELLRDLGYQVLEAPCAASALEIVERGEARIDLLFTDVVMPGPVRSVELAARARELVPELEVLFTTGYTEDAIVRDGRLEPGVHLLRKPYSRDELAARVRGLLGAPAAPRDEGDSSLRVLLVEDDADSRELASEMLGMLGHDVRAASSAEEASRALAADEFDVLFTDVTLPGVSGLDLAREALRDRAALAVVLASGHDAGSLRVEGGLERAAVLTKPYLPADVEVALRTATAARRAQRPRRPSQRSSSAAIGAAKRSAASGRTHISSKGV